ncbi:mitochondrial inner membrane protease ATP23 homolog [Ciona intestinalis]
MTTNVDTESENPLQKFQNSDAQTRRSVLFSWLDFAETPVGVSKLQDILHQVLKVDHEKPFLTMMWTAMADAGCAVDVDKHITFQPCNPELNMAGLFDPTINKIILCQNVFQSMSTDNMRASHMKHVLTHELIHAYDTCRADVDFMNNHKHKMCGEVRAAALSGECMFKYRSVSSTLAGFKSAHQKCVRRHALGSFMAEHPSISKNEANKIADEVFTSCYNDHEPFDRLPLSDKHAQLSFKAYLTRHRYSME